MMRTRSRHADPHTGGGGRWRERDLAPVISFAALDTSDFRLSCTPPTPRNPTEQPPLTSRNNACTLVHILSIATDSNRNIIHHHGFQPESYPLRWIPTVMLPIAMDSNRNLIHHYGFQPKSYPLRWIPTGILSIAMDSNRYLIHYHGFQP